MDNISAAMDKVFECDVDTDIATTITGFSLGEEEYKIKFVGDITAASDIWIGYRPNADADANNYTRAAYHPYEIVNTTVQHSGIIAAPPLTDALCLGRNMLNKPCKIISDATLYSLGTMKLMKNFMVVHGARNEMLVGDTLGAWLSSAAITSLVIASDGARVVGKLSIFRQYTAAGG